MTQRKKHRSWVPGQNNMNKTPLQKRWYARKKVAVFIWSFGGGWIVKTTQTQ